MSCLVIEQVYISLQAEDLVQELHRLSSENQKLAEKLSYMSENYNLLKKQLSQVMVKNNSTPERDQTIANNNNKQLLRKRKVENTDTCKDNNMIGNNTDCISNITDEDSSFRRPASKVSRVMVRTQPSDTSLVTSSLSCLHFLLVS